MSKPLSVQARALRCLRFCVAACFAAFFVFSGSADAAQTDVFANGADVSWVSQEEASGHVFRDSAGVKADPFALLKRLGVNAVRLRVWVDPEGGWCGGEDTLKKAQRAAAQGQRIMIDFHYSDNWADPGKQTVPAAWKAHTAAQLAADVRGHTIGTLGMLKANGIDVAWVQVGNEINGGMLWPKGAAPDFAQLAAYLNSGYDAVKAVYPDAQVVIHLANGYDGANFRWFFDGIAAAGAKWDVIGMSHYPPPSGWPAYNRKIAITMRDVVRRYGRPVMVVEAGMDWRRSGAARRMLRDLIGRVKAQGGMGQGVFYWEPEAFPDWQGYAYGATDASGKFTQAMRAFLHSFAN